MSGYIKVCRGLWDDAAFADEKFSEREAWLWMISEASWKSREVRRDCTTIHLNRGQLSHSVRFMTERWGWSKSRVDRFLKRLAARDMIGTASGTGFVVVTICKSYEYQSGWDTRWDSAGTPAGHSWDKREAGKTLKHWWWWRSRGCARGDPGSRSPARGRGDDQARAAAGGDGMRPLGAGRRIGAHHRHAERRADGKLQVRCSRPRPA